MAVNGTAAAVIAPAVTSLEAITFKFQGDRIIRLEIAR